MCLPPQSTGLRYLTKVMNNKEAGYIALISAIIAMAILLSLAVGLSNTNFLSRLDTQQVESKERSRARVYGCLEYARYRMAEGAYSGTETINIGSSTCTILAIESAPGQKIIKATATENRSTTNLKLIVNNLTLETISIEEVSSL